MVGETQAEARHCNRRCGTRRRLRSSAFTSPARPQPPLRPSLLLPRRPLPPARSPPPVRLGRRRRPPTQDCSREGAPPVRQASLRGRPRAHPRAYNSLLEAVGRVGLGDRCFGMRSRPRPATPRPRRRRSARTTAGYASDQRADPDARDGLPRRSFTGKIRHRAKVRVRSPRTAAVRAEEVERMRAASRRKREEEVARRGLERFAVVKCSSDPQRDFRESMVEMICEKGLGRPEEMESLLACYLALNSDEHHDVIVKVFRQVWFELNLERLAHESNRRR
ncbi:transcription repressor OFP1-like [Musa acuminata AAA Group]|uniref:transcription repressor OFP1-like n=1 Tax=Musa acuminata AAA Group TaxID=214697 RepID=UPI0031D94188